MAREIRITVDDDEVFERMKRRKRDLDLSWEEVLHRGLRPDQGRGARDSHHDHGPSSAPGGGRGSGIGGDAGARRDSRASGRREDDQWDAFAESVESEIQQKVYDTLKSSLGAAGVDVPDYPGDEMDELERAEDATLAFEFLDDRPAYRVPLRVNLHTGRDGVDVEVVAVRQGKNVSDTNRFDGDARKQVNAQLAGGDAAELRFADGAESYRVRPVLSWGRDESGDPTVTDVDIDEVFLDDDR